MANSYFPERLRSSTNGASPVGTPTIGIASPSSTASQSSAAPKLGALQGRIANVLSASYSDLEIRDTLGTLDARNIQNTAETRRNLRLDVQKELIECNGEIVKDFGQVAEQLRRVGKAIAELNGSCAAIRAHVAAAKRETGPMLEESSQMTAQKTQAETKQRLLGAFNKHFLLSDAEVTALTSTAEPVDDEYFDALARVKTIHNDSQILLGSEDQHLGLEILDQSSKQLNAAFQKLFRWAQRELKTLDLEDPHLSIPVRRGLRVLAERPTLFQNCLDFFAENREHILSDAFYAALTGTAARADGTVAVPSRAIEMNAHDPQRYVSDMLAWAHAATVGEREALQILFISDAEEISKGFKAGRQSQPWLQSGDTDDGGPEIFDGKKALNDLVDRDLSGVTRQLRQRLEQIVQSHEDATLVYQISNLVRFYCSIFASLLGHGSATEETLLPVIAMAMEHFRSITRDHIVNLHADVTSAPSNLAVPDFLEEALETLKGLMRSYETSMAGAATLQERNAGFEPVLVEALEPYLAGCDDMAKQMDPPHSEIFTINCLSATRTMIKGPSYTAGRVLEMDETIEDQEKLLVNAVHSWFVAESGMHYLLEALQPYLQWRTAEQVQKASKHRLLRAETLAETGQQLDVFLPTAMEDARSFIKNLHDKAMLRRICETAADRFTEQFEAVERLFIAIDELELSSVDQKEQDDQVLLRDVFPRTSDEIRVLLS